MGSIIWDRETSEAYDATYAYESVPSVVGPMVDLLVEFADGGPVLEFAVGTGRVALPSVTRRTGLWRRALSAHGRAASEKARR